MALYTPVHTLLADIIKDFRQFSFRSDRGILALKTILACLLALIIAWEINIADPTWAAWTAFVMLQSSRGSTLMQLVERIASTLICLFAGVMLLCFFGDNVLLLLLLSIIGLTFCFYFMAKSKSPFVWMYGPLTFLLVLFQTVNDAPEQIMSVAYDRGLEVVIGVLCGLAITLLFKTPATRHELKRNNLLLLKKLSLLQEDCMQRYINNVINPEFLTELVSLQNLIENQTMLRRFVKQENFFNSPEKINHRLLEQVVFMSQEIISDLYWRHTNIAFDLLRAFIKPLTQLQQRISATLSAMMDFVASDGELRAAFHAQLKEWRLLLAQLMEEAALFREQGPYFSVEASTEWAYFLVRQEAFFLLIDNFSRQAQLAPPQLSQRESLRHRFAFDRYYWEYALKTSLMAVLFPYLGLYLNLPGVTSLAVVVIVTLQFDLSITKHNLLLVVLGAVVGTGFGLLLIACNFTSSWAYLAGIALIGYFLAYAKHGPPSYSFAGWLAAYMFFACVTGSLGPITDWIPMLMGLIEIIFAALLMLIILIWVWPFSDAKILQHYQAQLVWYQSLIQNALHKLFQKRTGLRQNTQLFYTEINLLRQQIKALDGFHWGNLEFAQQSQEVVMIWYRCYHTLAALSLSMQSLNLLELDATTHHFTEAVLSLPIAVNPTKLQGLRNEIAIYRHTLTERFIKREACSFVEGIKVIYLLMVLENLTAYQQELIAKTAVGVG